MKEAPVPRPRLWMLLLPTLLSGCSDTSDCTRAKYVDHTELANRAIADAMARNANRIARGEARINYRSIEDFRRENPYCCRIDESKEAWSLMTHDPDSVVITVHYRARTEGNEQYFYETKFVTRCGKVTETFGSDTASVPRASYSGGGVR